MPKEKNDLHFVFPECATVLILVAHGDKSCNLTTICLYIAQAQERLLHSTLNFLYKTRVEISHHQPLKDNLDYKITFTIQ